jgi:hypothetical protein
VVGFATGLATENLTKRSIIALKQASDREGMVNTTQRKVGNDPERKWKSEYFH